MYAMTFLFIFARRGIGSGAATSMMDLKSVGFVSKRSWAVVCSGSTMKGKCRKRCSR